MENWNVCAGPFRRQLGIQKEEKTCSVFFIEIEIKNIEREDTHDDVEDECMFVLYLFSRTVWIF